MTVDDVYAAAAALLRGGAPHEDARPLGRRRRRGRARAPRGRAPRSCSGTASGRPRSTRPGIPYRSAAEPDRGRAGRDRRGGHGLDEGLGPPPAAGRPQLPRAARLEGRLALVVRRALPPPLDGGARATCASIETVHRILDAEAPDEVETVGLSPEDTLLVERTCTRARRAVPRPAPAHPLARRAQGRGASLRSSRWNAAKALLTAAKARLAGPPPAPPRGRPRRPCSSCPTPRSGGARRARATTPRRTSTTSTA